MRAELTNDQLRRAADDLRRIEDFLRSRTEWHAAPDGAATLRAADDAAVRLIGALEPHRGGSPEHSPGGAPAASDPLPSAELDQARLAKMVEFMVRLGDWIAIRAGGAVEAGAEQLAAQACRSLLGIRSSLASILANSQDRGGLEGAGAAASEEAAASPVAASAASPRSGRRQPSAPPSPPRPSNVVSRSERLVLADSVQSPLLQTTKDQTELTPHTRALLEEFLQRNGLEYSGYQRIKFEAEVERRLTTMPPGQVLVLKVGEYDGEPKPYFSYVGEQQPEH